MRLYIVQELLLAAVESLTNDAHHVIYLAFGDTERRRKRDGIQNSPADEAAFKGPSHHQSPSIPNRLKAFLGRFVADELNPSDQPHAPHIADERMIQEAT